MDILFLMTQSPLSFQCEHYRIWRDRHCYKEGFFDGKVSISTVQDSVYGISLDKESPVELSLGATFMLVRNSGDMITLRSNNSTECSVLSFRDEVSCVRISLNQSGEEIEFYGKLDRSAVRTAPARERRLPSKKDEYREEMINEVRLMYRNNTYAPAPIDIQAEIVAFASRKFMEFYDNYHENDRDTILEPMRAHIFKDTWSLMYTEIQPGIGGAFLDGVVSDAKEWYDNLTKNPSMKVRMYVASFYQALYSSLEVDYSLFLARFAY